MNRPSSSPPLGTKTEQSPPLEQRLAFLQITATDRDRLRAVAPQLAACSDAFVEQFYDHLFAFAETARFLQDPATVERLKRLQKDHLRSMLEDEVNDDYLERRRRLGDVHAHVGVGPQLLLGGYNQYLQFVLRQLAADPQVSLPEFLEQVSALLKAIFLDAELTLEAYFTQATQNFRQALELVFRANTELRQFAQLTSHDLKTPLSTVANLCDEALDEFGKQMPPDAAKLIEAAKQRTYRMSGMIDELLEMSTSVEDFEANAEVDSREVLEEARERLGPRLAQHETELILDGGLPTVWGNRVRLREAFYNLLSNAVKFIDRGPGRIVVSADVTPDACTFHFADNGPGIPQENLERIFSPFRRLRSGDDQPGSGLGLYFTRNLVEQQGGRVWAESTPGQGSVFHVLLKKHA